MRIWDVSPTILCRKHLLGEHRELHALYVILSDDKKVGYRNHPETKRWVGKLPALYNRYRELVIEMTRRGYKHNSELKREEGSSIQDMVINTLDEQMELLKNKSCDCPLN